MTSGGRRNRSGQSPDERSGRSEKRGYRLEALPAEGYDGDAPSFPLMRRTVMRWEYEDKRRYEVVDTEATTAVAEREESLWEWAWSTPQACAWSLPSQAWRIHTIAMWVRTFVICESDQATAADKSSLHRFADQVGLTTAGLAEMGWKIADAEPSGEDDDSDEEADGGDGPPKRQRRLRSVPPPDEAAG